MSDHLQDSSKMIASVAEDLTVDMNVAAVSGRSFAELINAIDARKSGSVPVKPKGAPKKTPGISPVHQANTAEEIVIFLIPLISERFALSNRITKKLLTQLGMYFKATGIVNESCVGMMTKSSSWAVPESFAISGQSLKQLMVPVLLLLTKLVTYTVQLRHERLHLSTGVLFADLATW